MKQKLEPARSVTNVSDYHITFCLCTDHYFVPLSLRRKFLSERRFEQRVPNVLENNRMATP